MLVSGLPPIGCLPIQMTAHSPLVRECLEEENTDAQVYNAKLVTLLPEIQGALPGSTILYSDAYTPMMNFINDPQRYGNLYPLRIFIEHSQFISSVSIYLDMQCIQGLK